MEEARPDHGHDHRANQLSCHGFSWRYQLAVVMAGDDTDRHPGDLDPALGSIVEVIRHDRYGNPFDRTDGDFVKAYRQAHRLHLDPLQRLHIEARVMAKQSRAAIADRLNLTEFLVSVYEDCFFAARDHLNTNLVIYSAMDLDYDEPIAVRRTVLTYALQGGAVAAEGLLRHLDVLGNEHDLSTLEGRQREQVELGLRSEAIYLGLVDIKPALLIELMATIAQPGLTAPTVAELLKRQAREVADQYEPVWQDQLDADATQATVNVARNRRYGA